MRCTAKAKSHDGQCKRYAVPGLDKCRIHCGLSPDVAREKGQENITRVKIGVLLTALAPEEEYEDPLEGLQMEILRSAAAVEVLGQMVSDLDDLTVAQRRVVQKSEPQPTESNPGATAITERTVTAGDAQVHVVVRMWNEERERHARFCKLAIDAGLSERMVRVQERHAAVFANLISAALDDPDLGLDDTQRTAARKVFGRHLRALPSAG